jgi:hypothetical protein
VRREIEALGTAGADSSGAAGESPEDLRRRETARAAVAAVGRWAVRLLPASVVAACVLQVLPVVVVVARAARRRGFRVGVPPFVEWALPFASVWLLAAGLALLAARSEAGGAVGANLVALYALGAAVQGVAVLVALHRRSPYPGVRIALWIAATLLLGPFLPGALALLGTADLWFDFRRPRATEGP